ncbi:methylated-DNA--protein-cysteine methyltransferase [Thermococcus sp.]
MLSVERFKISGREFWIAVIFEDKINGITFSLDGRGYLKERINSLVDFLIKRNVNVDLEKRMSPFTKLVHDTLIGKIDNEETMKYLSFRGVTPFEQKVYEILTKNVKRGNVITYGELAKLGRTSPRAVGGAMKRNPYPIIVPCHRVVSSDGMGFYTPKIEYKRFLLSLEGVEKWTE